MLDLLYSHPEWTERERDDLLGRIVERFSVEEVVNAVSDRLEDLGGNDADALVRLIEANPTPRLLASLKEALVVQDDLPPERIWNALALLEGHGLLEGEPSLAERWEELNEVVDEDGSIEELVAQIEEDPQGVWLALQGLGAVEPEVRPGIVAGLSGRWLGPRLVEFLRLLVYAHDRPTSQSALDVLAADADVGPAVRGAWADLAAHHSDPRVIGIARTRLGDRVPPGTMGNEAGTAVASTEPRVVDSLVTTIDGLGRGSVIISSRHKNARATALFVCDVVRGVVTVSGDVVPEAARADDSFTEFAAGIDRAVVLGAHELALGLLRGSLLLGGPTTPPALRYWVEATCGSGLTPRPFRAELPGGDPASISFAETTMWAKAVLDACDDWLDRSEKTYEIAEELELRAPGVVPEPSRDSGAFRYLFEHRIRDQIDTYRRMLLWMAWFWRAAGDEELGRPALALERQLSDAQHVVPGHPFIVAILSRSLAAAQADLRRGIDPREANSP